MRLEPMGIGFGAQASDMERVTHQKDRSSGAIHEPLSSAGHRLPGVPTDRNDDDCGVLDSMRHEVLAAHRCFADHISFGHPTRYHDERGQPIAVESRSMVQPGSEDIGGPPIVLRRTQDHDRITGFAAILSTHG